MSMLVSSATKRATELTHPDDVAILLFGFARATTEASTRVRSGCATMTAAGEGSRQCVQSWTVTERRPSPL
jgi:hypothetical protein